VPIVTTFENPVLFGAVIFLCGEERANCFARVRDLKRFSHMFEELCSEKMGNQNSSCKEKVPSSPQWTNQNKVFID